MAGAEDVVTASIVSCVYYRQALLLLFVFVNEAPELASAVIESVNITGTLTGTD